MKNYKNLDSTKLQKFFKSLSYSDAENERKKLVKTYIEEISQFVEEQKKTIPGFEWKDLPWPVQFLPVIVACWPDREMLNYMNPQPEMGKLSGFMGYSKDVLHKKFPERFIPVSVFFPKRPALEKALAEMKKSGLSFRLFAKPDAGERAAFVQAIDSASDLKEYLKKFPAQKALLLQASAKGKFEFGVQVVRSLETREWEITSFEKKVVPNVTGDGTSTIEVLISKLDITDSQKDNILNDLPETLRGGVVPSKEECVRVVFTASISRGTSMESVLISPSQKKRLSLVMKDIFGELPYASAGRFDLMAGSVEDLIEGKFQIIELNGSAGIPLQVYDTNLSVSEVYKELFTHFRRLIEIGKNNKLRLEKEGVHLKPFKTGENIAYLIKCILQQRSQIKNVASSDTLRSLWKVRKKTRRLRYNFLRVWSQKQMRELFTKNN